MITCLSVINSKNQEIKLELSDPQKSGFVVTDITGIGPGKVDVNITELYGMDGGVYNSVRASSRNIVITLRFIDSADMSIEKLRLLSYQYFPIKQLLTLRFYTDSRISEIAGYVESNDPVIFSKEESTQISIICPNPFFYSEKANITNFYSEEALFEFPFSNESLTEKLLIFGEHNDSQYKVVTYDGEIETGFKIHIFLLGNVTGEISIINRNTQDFISLDTDKITEYTGSSLEASDEIIICTERGNKYVKLLKNGVYTNIINSLTIDSNWLTLNPGENIFGYIAEPLESIMTSIEYIPLFGGV